MALLVRGPLLLVVTLAAVNIQCNPAVIYLQLHTLAGHRYNMYTRINPACACGVGGHPLGCPHGFLLLICRRACLFPKLLYE